MPPPIPAGTVTALVSRIPDPIIDREKKLSDTILVWAIAAFCIFGWEWFLCVTQEYKLIWKKSKNLLSGLYIANRYFALLQLIFVLTLLVPNTWSYNACNHGIYLWQPVGALISSILSQMILGSRVYSIFSPNKLVAFHLGITLLAEVVITVTFCTGVNIIWQPPPLLAPPCWIGVKPAGPIISWSLALFYYTSIFILTAWKAYGYSKDPKETNTPLYNIIWRDGLPYFFFISIIILVNIIVLATVPDTLTAVILTPTVVLEVVLSCRLALKFAAESSDSKPASDAGIHPQLDDSESDIKVRLVSDEKLQVE